MTFSSLGLTDLLLRAIDDSGYTEPFPIQIEAIPAVLSGKDIMAAAQTGTGKTASFTLPLLQRLASGPKVKSNHIRALVLTPTRELAVQVAESVVTYGKHLPLRSGVVYGGVKINPQMMRLRSGLDVLVATPGRLLDLARQNAVKFPQVEILVLDEADRMLDMGFIGDIRKILVQLPRKRQNLLFSATFSSDIRKLTNELLHHPVQIEVSPRNKAAASVRQMVYEADKSQKAALLSHLVRNKNWNQVLVFVRTKKGADQLVQQLGKDGISTVAIHGDKRQNERSRALAKFKMNRVRVLVATDVAARGLDINELPHVVNFDLPKVAEDYIHRIGRTGRAGLEGEGISLVSAHEVKLLAAIETLIRQTLERVVEPGFVPSHNVPLTRPSMARAKKPKKPKKPKQVQGHNDARKTGEQKGSSSKPGGGRKPQKKDQANQNEGGRRQQRSEHKAVATKKRPTSKADRSVVEKKTNRKPRQSPG